MSRFICKSSKCLCFTYRGHTIDVLHISFVACQLKKKTSMFFILNANLDILLERTDLFILMSNETVVFEWLYRVGVVYYPFKGLHA